MNKIILKILAVYFTIISFGITAGQAQEQPSLETLTGIPVMAGLSEDFDQRIIFDKPEGRIIHVVLAGDISPAQALEFYRDVLYQLGWQALDTATADGLELSRDQERLTVVVTQNSPLELVLDLKPAS